MYVCVCVYIFGRNNDYPDFKILFLSSRTANPIIFSLNTALQIRSWATHLLAFISSVHLSKWYNTNRSPNLYIVRYAFSSQIFSDVPLTWIRIFTRYQKASLCGMLYRMNSTNRQNLTISWLAFQVVFVCEWYYSEIWRLSRKFVSLELVVVYETKWFDCVLMRTKLLFIII